MAGRFLTVDEAAAQLGIEPDEVNRLVDRKKLFPMRDGAFMKFRYDDVVRYAETVGESSDAGLSLDLDAAAGVGGKEQISILDMDLGSDAIGEAMEGGASIFDDAGGSKGVSETILRGGSGPAIGGDANISAIAIDEPDSPGSLVISSVVGGALGSGGGTGSGATTGGGSAALSNVAGVTGIGDQSGLSIAGESGLSLEDDDVQVSGIQLSGVDLSGAGFAVGDGSGIDLGAVGNEENAAPDGGTMLAGDAFELGVSAGDDESASVVIATDSESGDSSFFGATMVGGESGFSEESSSVQSGQSSIQFPIEPFVGTTFTTLQICGLVCCSLLLLVGGFICLDLVWSIGSMRGAGLSAPILEGLTTSLGLQ